MSEAVVTLVRRTGGVEVTVTADPATAKDTFYEVCEELDGFPGYGSSKSVSNISQKYAIKAAIERRKQDK